MIDYDLRTLIGLFTGGTAADDIPLFLDRDVVEGDSPYLLVHPDFHSLYFAERGRGIHVIDSVRHSVARGDIYVMPVGSEHTYLDGEGLVLASIHFSTGIFDGATWAGLEAVPGFEQLLGAGEHRRRLHLTPSSYAEVSADLAELWKEWQGGGPSGAIIAPALLLRLLVRLARFADDDAPSAAGGRASAGYAETVVAEAVRTIDVSEGGSARVADLAAAAGLSRYRFSEIFASVMGQTPSDYIRHVRLEHAKKLLARTALPLSEIARTTGFADQAHFTRSFRAAMAATPSEFRRRAQG